MDEYIDDDGAGHFASQPSVAETPSTAAASLRPPTKGSGVVAV